MCRKLSTNSGAPLSSVSADVWTSLSSSLARGVAGMLLSSHPTPAPASFVCAPSPLPGASNLQVLVWSLPQPLPSSSTTLPTPPAITANPASATGSVPRLAPDGALPLLMDVDDVVDTGSATSQGSAGPSGAVPRTLSVPPSAPTVLASRLARPAVPSSS